ncbi:hypothetical protein [Clostridium sartagoforme]|uniref:hypothetical protein n=1 Tax=Clostridium sartagoforme TaxID=84031 RepID=UPI0031E27E67
MEKVKEYFDDFTFHARVVPVLVILLPIIVLGICKGVVGENILQIPLYTIVSIIFLAFTARIARELGKKYEEKMYIELKGMPTTIILRYSDNTLNSVTKRRYHEKLNKIVDGVVLPIQERDENIDSDEQYRAAINWLRNYANSNRETEFRVYQELKEYNFWRNLYGSRFIAIGLYILITIREILLINNFDFKEFITKPSPTYIPLIIMMISIILFLAVNKKTIKRKAFDYAKSLVEVCERL